MQQINSRFDRFFLHATANDVFRIMHMPNNFPNERLLFLFLQIQTKLKRLWKSTSSFPFHFHVKSLVWSLNGRWNKTIKKCSVVRSLNRFRKFKVATKKNWVCFNGKHMACFFLNKYSKRWPQFMRAARKKKSISMKWKVERYELIFVSVELLWEFSLQAKLIVFNIVFNWHF